MKNLPTYNEFINESVIIKLKGLMKMEFMNDINMKLDFETAKRLLYMETSGILEHIEADEFILRTLKEVSVEDFDRYLVTVNDEMKRFKFDRSGKPKTDKVKEHIWKLKAKLK